MIFQKPYPQVRGTRTGYVTRYTCPACTTENIIVNRSSTDPGTPAGIVSCRHCRARMTVLAPVQNR